MVEDEICGHEKVRDSEPCQFQAKYPDGKCGHHTECDEPVEKEPKKQGRPSKLSYQRQEQICGAIEKGRSVESAARRAGVSVPTVYNWIDRGQSEVEAGKENEYTEFFKRFTQARGEGEEWYFSMAMEIAKEEGDHRFIASLMKQRYPDAWGDTETGVDATQIDVSSDVVEITEDQIRRSQT